MVGFSIFFEHRADDYTRGYMPSRAMVNSDGKVFWPPPTKFRSTCPVDVTYFPFDDQICKLKLGSWTYNGFQVSSRAGNSFATRFREAVFIKMVLCGLLISVYA
jgi:hypothetical protein